MMSTDVFNVVSRRLIVCVKCVGDFHDYCMTRYKTEKILRSLYGSLLFLTLSLMYMLSVASEADYC